MNFYDLMMWPLEKKWLIDKRKWLIKQLKGEILEIGFGTGANFKLMPIDTSEHLTAVDLKIPSARALTAHVTFIEGDAQALPFPDNTFDTVFETLVLCSVPNLEQAIGEIARVLKPGGSFVFMDHVLPTDKTLVRFFKFINPVWHRIAHGCQLVRTPAAIYEKHGLLISEKKRFGKNIFEYGIAKKIA